MKIKFAYLTPDQRNQVVSFLKEEIRDKKVTLNQMFFNVNSRTGNIIFHKDF